MYKSLVSIIIPAYNSEFTLERCLVSALEQCYPNIEIIVVDDGSTDATANVAGLYSDKISFYSQSNKGACAARNLGVIKSQGEYIKFLDADDFLARGAISKQVYILERSSSDKVIPYGYRYVFNGNESLVIKDIVSNQNQKIDLINKNITITLPLHRKEALISIGLFDEQLRFRQEWELHLRLAHNGYLFEYHDDCIFTQVISDTPTRISSRKLIFKDEIENIDYVRSKFNYINSNASNQAWAKKYWDLARQFVKLNRNKEANKTFEISRSISSFSDIKGYPFFYKLAVFFGGPLFAEKLISFYKGLKE